MLEGYLLSSCGTFTKLRLRKLLIVAEPEGRSFTRQPRWSTRRSWRTETTGHFNEFGATGSLNIMGSGA